VFSRRVTLIASLAVALAAPAAASASTDAEFLQLLKQAQGDMPLVTATQEHGELPKSDPQITPTPVATPTPAPTAVATPAPAPPSGALQPKPPKPAVVVADGTKCRVKAGQRRCETHLGGQLAKVCVSKRRTRTCTQYKDGHAARRCVRIAGRNRCRTLSGAVGRASTLSWQGWPSTVSPAVGKIVTVDAAGKSWVCSGTVVSRTLMLTAAHCLFDSAYHKKVYFAPGASAASDRSIVMPNGSWEASNWWVPDGYRLSKDNSLDYGLVEIPPVGGRYIGDVTGSFSITPNLPWNTGRRAYLMGYPSTGTFTNYSNSQYACDVSWNEGYSRSGTGYDIWAACTMTPGSSGGPWFAKDANDKWTVAGVNSRCSGPVDANGKACMPYANYMITSYIDSRFYTFWNSVSAQRRY
jgi:V8-like Glu-specific endopeptidase